LVTTPEEAIYEDKSSLNAYQQRKPAQSGLSPFQRYKRLWLSINPHDKTDFLQKLDFLYILPLSAGIQVHREYHPTAFSLLNSEFSACNN
jgi:hypothetical protein